MDSLDEPYSWFVGYMMLDEGELANISDNVPDLEEYVRRLGDVETVEIGSKTLRNSRYFMFKLKSPVDIQTLYVQSFIKTPELRGLTSIKVTSSVPHLSTEQQSVEHARRNLLLHAP